MTKREDIQKDKKMMDKEDKKVMKALKKKKDKK